MGPISKDAVCSALGNLIDEAQQQRVLLQQIRALLQVRGEEESEETIQIKKRLAVLERRLGQ